MSIKRAWIVECDFCGAADKAKETENTTTVTPSEAMKPDIPDGWYRGFNKDFCICPQCWYKFNGKSNIKPENKPSLFGICQYYSCHRDDPKNGWCNGTRERDSCPYAGDWRECERGKEG